MYLVAKNANFPSTPLHCTPKIHVIELVHQNILIILDISYPTYFVSIQEIMTVSFLA